MQKVQEEAETTLGMLAFDAFPRFLKSKYCNAVMDDLRQTSNPNEVMLYVGVALRTTFSWSSASGLAHCGGNDGLATAST